MRRQVGLCERGFYGRISGSGFQSSPEQSDVVVPDRQIQTGPQSKNQYYCAAGQCAGDGKTDPAKPYRGYEHQPDGGQIQITVMDIVMPGMLAQNWFVKYPGT